MALRRSRTSRGGHPRRSRTPRRAARDRRRSGDDGGRRDDAVVRRARSPRQTRNAFSTFLFPTYDEIVLSYPTLNFLAPGDHPNVHDPDPYWAMIIAGGWNVGT
ncbi:MAG: hypothetical protein WKF58_17850 [Ilumatobacteraceae bacterium]